MRASTASPLRVIPFAACALALSACSSGGGGSSAAPGSEFALVGVSVSQRGHLADQPPDRARVQRGRGLLEREPEHDQHRVEHGHAGHGHLLVRGRRPRLRRHRRRDRPQDDRVSSPPARCATTSRTRDSCRAACRTWSARSALRAVRATPSGRPPGRACDSPRRATSRPRRPPPPRPCSSTPPSARRNRSWRVSGSVTEDATHIQIGQDPDRRNYFEFDPATQALTLEDPSFGGEGGAPINQYSDEDSSVAVMIEFNQPVDPSSANVSSDRLRLGIPGRRRQLAAHRDARRAAPQLHPDRGDRQALAGGAPPPRQPLPGGRAARLPGPRGADDAHSGGQLRGGADQGRRLRGALTGRRRQRRVRGELRLRRIGGRLLPGSRRALLFALGRVGER